jgi:hypothetical protein
MRAKQKLYNLLDVSLNTGNRTQVVDGSSVLWRPTKALTDVVNIQYLHCFIPTCIMKLFVRQKIVYHWGKKIIYLFLRITWVGEIQNWETHAPLKLVESTSFCLLKIRSKVWISFPLVFSFILCIRLSYRKSFAFIASLGPGQGSPSKNT